MTPDPVAHLPSWLSVSGTAALVLLLLPARFAQSQLPPPRAVLVDDQFPATEVERIGTDWTIQFQTEAGPRSVAAEDLVRWGRYTDSFNLMHVVLADGSLLAGQLTHLADEQLTIDGEICGRLEIPLARVRGVIVAPPSSAAARDRLGEQIATAQGLEDQLVLKNGDVLRGVLKSVQQREPSPLPGPLAATFAVAGREVTIPEERILAIIFNPALVDAVAMPAFYVLAGFRDGSLLNVARVAVSGPWLQLTLAHPVTLELDPYSLRTDLTLLQPIGGRVVYLSNLTPIGYRHIPYLATDWPLGRDRSTTGQRLRHGGFLVPKGLGMHSASRVAYPLDGQWRRFEAQVALDDTAGRHGSVVFRVFLGDEADQWQRAYESPVVRGGAPALPVSVELGAARAIALIVDFADYGDVLDRAAWLDARLTR